MKNQKYFHGVSFLPVEPIGQRLLSKMDFEDFAVSFVIEKFPDSFILRVLGQETVSQGKAPVKRAVQRRRLRTVIQNIVHFAGHVTKHARQLILFVSRSNAWAAAYLGLAARFKYA